MADFSVLSPVSSEEEPVSSLIAAEMGTLPLGVYVDVGPSLPDTYGVDVLRLMVQSPHRIFAYWGVSEQLMNSVLARFPAEDREGFRVMLQWLLVGDKQPRWVDVGIASHWWFDAVAGQSYQASLSLYSEWYGLVPLLCSNRVMTPPVAVAAPAHETSQAAELSAWLNRLLERTGVQRPIQNASASVSAIQAPTAMAGEAPPGVLGSLDLDRRPLGAAERPEPCAVQAQESPIRPTSGILMGTS